MKLLIAGGDSFTAETDCWPHYIARQLDYTCWNMAFPSAGNDFIYRSMIHSISTALKEDIVPVVMVMWTYPSRKSFFISSQETPTWELLKNSPTNYVRNPACFIEKQKHPHAYYLSTNPTSSGWVIGEANFQEKSALTDFRRNYFENYYTDEQSFIETLECMINLQNYCKVHNVKLINLIYNNDIFYHKGKHIKERYEKNCKYLYDMLDLTSWVFPGLQNFTISQGLSFVDKVHPGVEAQQQFSNLVIEKMRSV